MISNRSALYEPMKDWLLISDDEGHVSQKIRRKEEYPFCSEGRMFAAIRDGVRLWLNRGGSKAPFDFKLTKLNTKLTIVDDCNWKAEIFTEDMDGLFGNAFLNVEVLFNEGLERFAVYVDGNYLLCSAIILAD